MANEMKRYDIGECNFIGGYSKMLEDEAGEWVCADDHDRIVAKLRAKIEEQDAVITQRNAECSWKHHELAKLAELIDRLLHGLEWALDEIGMEPHQHASGDNADMHRAAIAAIADGETMLRGKEAIKRALTTGSSLPPEAFEPPKGSDA